MNEARDYSDSLKSGVVVVTGASEGLGRALCHALMSQNVRVAGIARRTDALDAVKNDAPKGLFLPILADVADPKAVEAGFEEIRKTWGPVSSLINNAGVYPHRDIIDETPESFMHTMSVNLGGPLFCAQQALVDMTERGFGRIVNVGSFADIAPAPVSAAYSVSKGALRVLTRALNADLADRFPNIVINDWMPGVLNTKMGLATGADPTHVANWGAKLALWHDPKLSGVVFEGDRSLAPHVGLKRRILMKITRQKPEMFLLS
jgi:NAD(P)-dependent dehydrogenase (short-subunit alcohol dehydrogenase family)